MAPTARPPTNLAAESDGRCGSDAASDACSREEHGDQDHHSLAAELVGHPAGNGRTENATEKQRAVDGPKLQRRQLEVLLKKRHCPCYDGNVKTK